MNQLIEITNDLFDIAARLKSVNGNYKLYFNPALDRFEVHDDTQIGGSLAFVVPYPELDARTVDYAMFTRVQNAATVFEEMDKHNTMLDKQKQAAAVEQVCAFSD